MLRHPLIAIATFVVAGAASFTPTLVPAAMAEAPKCKTKANKYVACTDRLKAKTPRKKAAYLKFETFRKGD